MNRLFQTLSALLIFPAALAAQQALLWVPAGQDGTAEVLGLLEGNRDLRLTAAFYDTLPKDLYTRAALLEKEGRLETVLRPAGDPPLPLLYYPTSPSVRWEAKPSTSSFSNDQYFLGLRLSLARDAALKEHKKVPAGLVNSPGGIVSDYFPLAKATGISWIACGPLSSTAAVMETGGVYAVPFAAYSTSTAAAPFLAFDETSSSDPVSVRAALEAALKTPEGRKFTTVSQALKLAVPAAASPAEIEAAGSPWTGDYTLWASSAPQAGALAALAKTRADLMSYLNSFQGNYKQAATAFDEYFVAEDGARLLTLGRAGPDDEHEAELAIQSALGNAYRVMRKPPPPWLFSSLADAALSADQEEKLTVTVKDGGFGIVNDPRRPEIPAQAAATPAAGAPDPYKVWKLSSMKLETGPDELVFRFYPAELDAVPASPSGFGGIRLDLYIDINHRQRAGMTMPLEGRPLRLYPQDAWEYALEITPAKASLYALTPDGPVVTGTYMPKAENGAVTLRVPRTALRGNPLLWGYAALLLAPKAGGELMITDYIAADVSGGYIYAVRPGDK
jgi:hypothetical protein